MKHACLRTLSPFYKLELTLTLGNLSLIRMRSIRKNLLLKQIQWKFALCFQSIVSHIEIH